MCEFSSIPRSPFTSDGSLSVCLDKSKLMAILEAHTQKDNEPRHLNSDLETITDNGEERDTDYTVSSFWDLIMYY